LPSGPMSGALPSQQGLDNQTLNELRPAASGNATQVLNVQSALAAAGFFRGPIDGNMTASTRAAIRQFQSVNRLPDTGELDAETSNRLMRSSAAGTAGSNGSTSTTGNRAAAGDPFANSFTGVPSSFVNPGTPATPAPTGPIFSTPFPIATPLNTSPAPPQGTTVQP
jgi:peptidoglycan hydrolase-like protein with peptidoglycan-binding domain